MIYIESCVCFLGNSKGNQELEILGGKKKKGSKMNAELTWLSVQ